MPLELFLAVLVAAVIAWGAWALWGVIHITYMPEPDMIDEVQQEREFLEAVSRAARS